MTPSASETDEATVFQKQKGSDPGSKYLFLLKKEKEYPKKKIIGCFATYFILN